MNFIVCVEDRMGISFNKRLLSRDKYLDDYLNQVALKEKLYVDENYMNYIKKENYKLTTEIEKNNKNIIHEINIFCSSKDTLHFLNCSDKVTIFFWNRRYPADVYLDYDYIRKNYKLIKSEDEISGSSHQLKLEIWKKIGGENE